MDIRLERAGRSLATFLEDDVSGTYLGLGHEARVHLDRFRSFLHSFYVQKHGYWPPTRNGQKSSSLPKTTYRAMYFEFSHLYEYLVDPASSSSIHENTPTDGGICVLQNVQAFDRRNKYVSLSHPLPLVPETSYEINRHKSSGMAKFFAGKQARMERCMSASAALSAATNSGDMEVMECQLVREYLRFEKMWTLKEEEKVSSGDARKVRWLLIYAILQTLISVTRAPTEVRHTEGVSYPLCCQTAGTPPWQIGVKALQLKETKKPIEVKIPEKVVEDVVEIKPDIDYFAQKFVSMPNTAVSTPEPRRIVTRTISVSDDLPLKSPQPLKTGFCEILIQGYGNGMNASDVDSDPDPSTPSSNAGGSGGWSTNSSEDGIPDMDHVSLIGTASFYGDNEEVEWVVRKNSLPVTRQVSTDNFQQKIYNPEVDQYLKS